MALRSFPKPNANTRTGGRISKAELATFKARLERAKSLNERAQILKELDEKISEPE